jgi:lipopolysaccharide export system permease protein
VYLVVLYKKYSVPVSAFILTIIAAAVSAMKRRGGITNLAIGLHWLCLCLLIKSEVMAEKSSIPPMLGRLPNIAFGILALYLLRNAKR